MPRRALLLILACYAGATSAQPHPAAHSVPLASRGNALELTLVAPTGRVPDSLVVNAAGLPSWLRLTPTQVRVASSEGSEAIARFTFDVDESATVGDTVSVRFEIGAATGQRWTREVRLVVGAPRAFELGAVYPNPLSGAARVPFLVPEGARVRVALFDVLGREIAVLADAEYEAGRHEVRLDGRHLAGGVYVVWAEVEQAASGQRVVSRRVTVVN